jgi:hypothetical protein
MYAIGTRPLIDTLNETTDSSKCQQVWYADDSSAGGKMMEVKKWWDILNEAGPKYGYYPKPSKTILIIKDSTSLSRANEIFSHTGITVTTTGERHLGAVIGSEDFRNEYINDKVSSWIQDVEQLAKLAIDEPQLAYTAYTKALCMRWCFLQRTIPNTSEYFVPLEEAIREKLIPAIIGRNVSDIERRYIALPVRLGGLCIQNPTVTADTEYANSFLVTRNLTDLIERQELNLTNYDADSVKAEIARLKLEKEENFVDELREINNLISDSKLKRCIELAGEKGASSWLTALPLQSMGYTLNKQEFRDAICLRYGWKIPNTPSFCSCKSKNTHDHTLNCKLGGYVNMRHNNIRDFEATLLKEVCRDVKIEPILMPLGETGTESANDKEKARLDVSAVGVWSSMERTFLDVRVMHPNSPSYENMTPKDIYSQHEKAKKRTYNNRILQVEKGTFTPLIFSTTGGMGPECDRYHKRVAELIAKKRNEEYSDVVSHIRTRLRFALLKSVLIAIRGERGRGRKSGEVPMEDLSLNLIPDRATYEV